MTSVLIAGLVLLFLLRDLCGKEIITAEDAEDSQSSQSWLASYVSAARFDHFVDSTILLT